MWTSETGSARPAASVSDAVTRLAVYLNYASGRAALRGRDPSVIESEHPCGVIARLIGLTMAQLETALADLRDKGLICPRADGALLLTDVRALQTLAMGKEPEPFVPVLKAAA
jgi:hypothetical protein